MLIFAVLDYRGQRFFTTSADKQEETMEFILVGLVAGVLGGLPLDLGKDGWQFKWPTLTVMLTLLWAGVAYLAMPQLIGPFWGIGLSMMVILGLVVNAIWCAILADHHRSSPAIPVLVACGAVVLVMGRGCAGCGAFQDQSYRAFVADSIEHRDWQNDMAPVDTVHIRMVSEQQAEWLGNKILGQAEGSLGSRYQVGTYAIQKVGNELVWVAPLEFNGFRSWSKFGTTPGYVMVSAEDPTQEPRLVVDHKMRYVSSAWFGDDLERHLYTNGYQARGLMDYTFEIDDSGKPHWVVTLFHPSIQYWGEELEGVLIVDPVTGDIEQKGLDDVPAWVDRIVPQQVAYDRLRWYGEYVKGWTNSWWGEEDVNVPTSSISIADMWLVWGEDGNAYWFTGFTSSKSTDAALVGFGLMDSRTGATRYYRLSGADETAVVEAVNSKVSNYSDYMATQPILYNIYGELTWAVPVISTRGIFQRLALVRAQTSEVTLGENKRAALVGYRRMLQASGNVDAPTAQASLKTVTGDVARAAADVQGGNTTYYFMLRADPHQRIFSGSTMLSYELPLVRPGDTVKVGFIETDEATVPMSSFDLVDIWSRRSEQQQRKDDLDAERTRAGSTKKMAKQLRSRLKGLSDEELLELIGTQD